MHGFVDTSTRHGKGIFGVAQFGEDIPGNAGFFGDFTHRGFVVFFFAFGVALRWYPLGAPATVLPCDIVYLVGATVFAVFHATGGNFPYSGYLARARDRFGTKPPRLWVATNPTACGRTSDLDIGWGAIGGTAG